MARASLLLPVDSASVSSLRSIILSFQAGVNWRKGKLSPLSVFKLIESDLGQLEPSSYKQPRGAGGMKNVLIFSVFC